MDMLALPLGREYGVPGGCWWVIGHQIKAVPNGPEGDHPLLKCPLRLHVRPILRYEPAN